MATRRRWRFARSAWTSECWKRETLLLLELSGALQGEAAEGSTLSLEVSGVGLESGGSLTVNIEVPEERMEDLRFSTMTFRLGGVSSSRIVEVFVLRGRTAGAPGAGADYGQRTDR